MQGCSQECKFCTVHKYGVFVLDASALLILGGILFFYWKDIRAYFAGRTKPIQQVSNDLSDRPRSPTEPFTGQNSVTVSIPPGYGQQPVIVQPPQVVPVVAPLSIQPQIVQQPPQLQSPQKTNQPPQSPQPKQPQAQMLTHQKQKTVTQPDPFKLPQPDATIIAKSDESTGSNYFKQMMQGKKPVASISQYMLKKHKKHHEKDGSGKKHHRHHHKK